MDKKTLLHLFQWVIALGACAFLVWKLATYDDYNALAQTLSAMSTPQWISILLCVALMPVNMTLDAWRWRTLLPMSWREAHRQVYYSKLAGLITPWRLGEYPARAMLQGEWKQTLSMGAVASVTMTAAIVIAGLIALGITGLEIGGVGDSYLYILGVIMGVMCLVLYFAPQILRRFASVSRRTILVNLMQSFVRLLCWCVQLALVLYALGAVYSSPLSLFIYYLLVTITPNVPIVEMGTRGAWAIVVFGSINAAMAGVLLWLINTLLPCLVGLLLQKKSE